MIRHYVSGEGTRIGFGITAEPRPAHTGLTGWIVNILIWRLTIRLWRQR